MTTARALVLVPEDRLDALEDLAVYAVELACMVTGRPTCLDDPEEIAATIIEVHERMHAAEQTPTTRETGT